MTFIRLILLVFVGYLARRLYLSWKSPGRSENRKSQASVQPEAKAGMKDLTDQDIDDADFEEIP